MKKLAIIGKGTAGTLALNHFGNYTDWEIDLYYDSSIKEQTVGEGTTLEIPRSLVDTIGMTWEDVRKLNGSVKTGIQYTGWSPSDYFHNFPLPYASMHIDAVKLQEYLIYMNEFTAIDKKVNADDIDADYIIDCSGKPNDYTDYNLTPNINVNAVCLMQFKPIKNIDHTLCIAMPNGWMFGIPLQNRISFGYLYNKDISIRQAVQIEMIEYLNKLGYKNPILENQFEFKNYYHTKNFTENKSCNGNASFFLEPLEATSLALVDKINRWTFDVINKNIDIKKANSLYDEYVKQIEVVIGLHYLNPIHSSDFWDEAKNNSQFVYEHKEFGYILQNLYNDNYFVNDFGTWTKDSFKQNIEGLSLNLSP